MASTLERSEAIAPSERDRQLAKTSARQLAALLQKQNGLTVRVVSDDDAGETLELPGAAIRLLSDILTEMARGNPVTIIPRHAEMTTQQAADFLNVSRPFLVDLLESGKIKFRRVGTHRRVEFQDVVEYKKRIDDERARALDELAEQAQDLGMGY